MSQVTALLQAEFLGNNVLTFGGFTLLIALTLVIAKLAEWLLHSKLAAWASKSDTKLDDILLEKLDKPVQYIILAVGLKVSLNALVLPEDVSKFAHHVIVVLVTMFVAWAITRVQDAVRKGVIDPWTSKSESKLDDQIVPILDTALKVAVWSMAVLIVFSNLGYDIISLLTGLGIGGLAVAMAAQSTLSNVFGSVTIFADQPFQVDDLIKVGEFEGVVEEVGLRTTRLRTIKGSLVHVPNSLMVAQPVENKSGGSGWRHDATLGLLYGTSAEELKKSLDALRDILGAHAAVRKHSVRFKNFGESALELSLTAWIEPAKYLETIHDLNLAIKERFDQNGWGMAFPTRTVYMVHDR